MEDRALGQAEDRLRLHERYGREIVFRFRLLPEERLEYVSPSVFAVTGYTAEECLGNSGIWSRLVDPADPGTDADVMAKAAAGEPLILRWKRSDGATIWVDLRASALVGENGRPYALEGAVREIGARLRAEITRDVTYRIAAAAAEEHGLAELFDGIHGSVSRLMDATNFFIALYFEEDRTVSISYFVDQNDPGRDRYRGINRRPFAHGMTEYIIRTGEPFLADCTQLDDLARRGEIDPRKPPNAQSWAGVPLRDGERIIGVMAVASYRAGSGFTREDLELLTFVARQVAMAINLRRANEDLKARAAALERSNKELERFAYVASHDLQEPLRAVTGFLQLLEKRFSGDLDDRGRQYIGRAVAAAARMRRMIDSLLEWARVTTRAEAFGPVAAEEALRLALDNLQTAIAEAGARIDHGPLPMVNADAAQLMRLFQNLIGNALKFSDGAPHVTVRAEDAGGEWRFSVQDDGIGIPEEQRERIFGIFQRLHERDRYPGSGIGLSLCRKIVERHGGRIWAEAAPGRGSVFLFTVPKRGEKAG